jgi:hypothetical protein
MRFAPMLFPAPAWSFLPLRPTPCHGPDQPPFRTGLAGKSAWDTGAP